MKITRVGTTPSGIGSEANFTGTVRQDKLFAAEAPGRVGGGANTFEPGARTRWHTHPAGQILIITAGRGCVQTWGEPIREVFPGDVVWIPEGEKHWHGAGPTTAMVHISVTESLGGSAVTWLEPVTDEQYLG